MIWYNSMIRNKFVFFVDGVSIQKNDSNLTSCATRNDAVFRHFFRMGTSTHTQKMNHVAHRANSILQKPSPHLSML
jgi:hypothetical protein